MALSCQRVVYALAECRVLLRCCCRELRWALGSSGELWRALGALESSGEAPLRPFLGPRSSSPERLKQ
eukprot:11888376-Alexandrium_andersonii.AAC.1